MLMKFKSESLPSQVIHAVTTMKVRPDDPLRVYFDHIDWGVIPALTDTLYAEDGASAYDPIAMYKALLLIYLGEAHSERDLAERLRFDVRLQTLCQFDYFQTPSHAAFSSFRKRLGPDRFYQILHRLLAQAIALGVISGQITAAIDSTHIWANANTFGVKICQCPATCHCLRKYADPDARWGHKTETYTFFGYKIHLIIDTASHLPLDVIVTSGEVADNTQAISLLDGARQHHPDVQITSAAMDAAYDDTTIYHECVTHQIHPIIALNPRNTTDPAFTLTELVRIDEHGHFFCHKTGFRLLHNGSEPKRKGRMKLICPPTGARNTCPFRDHCCPTSKIGKTFYLYPAGDVRLLGTIPRGSLAWKRLYNTRSAAERTNAQLKSPTHQLAAPRVRGLDPITIHVCLSLAGLIIKTIGNTIGRLRHSRRRQAAE
jgi:transposase